MEHYLGLLHQYYPHIESYFPVYLRLCRPHGCRRPVEVVSPVYPGYLFLKVNCDNLFRPVSLPVKARWVRCGGNGDLSKGGDITIVPDIAVERLRKLEIAGELVREVKYVNPYRAGVAVRVHLPVQDIRGVIVKLIGGNRAVVENSFCRVLVPIHGLEVC
jgi:hypothetical protein